MFSGMIAVIGLAWPTILHLISTPMRLDKRNLLKRKMHSAGMNCNRKLIVCIHDRTDNARFNKQKKIERKLHKPKRGGAIDLEMATTSDIRVFPLFPTAY